MALRPIIDDSAQMLRLMLPDKMKLSDDVDTEFKKLMNEAVLESNIVQINTLQTKY